jgi:hypothetical protein
MADPPLLVRDPSALTVDLSIVAPASRRSGYQLTARLRSLPYAPVGHTDLFCSAGGGIWPAAAQSMCRDGRMVMVNRGFVPEGLARPRRGAGRVYAAWMIGRWRGRN